MLIQLENQLAGLTWRCVGFHPAHSCQREARLAVQMPTFRQQYACLGPQRRHRHSKVKKVTKFQIFQLPLLALQHLRKPGCTQNLLPAQQACT